MFEEEKAKMKSTDLIVGSEISSLSIDELEKRIGLLKEEIDRLRKVILEKQGSLSEAETIFKK